MVGTGLLRKLLATVAVAAVLLGLGVAPAGPAQAAVDRPTRMASLGDSITRGFNACGWFFDCASRSWSTGSDSAVNSHYRRLSAVRSLTAYNDARTGAKADALPGQASSAVSQGAKYATVLIGANDACTSSVSSMTTVDGFRTSIRTGLQTLASGGVTTVFVASVPDVYQLWQVGKSSSSARTAWAAYGICQSMLKSPTSTQQADVDRRAQVRQRVVDYNTVLAQECAAVTGCVFDGNAVFSYQFSLGQLTTWDYFHPNTAGQAALAAVTWSKVSTATGW
jgi:lysophospholipase L1-like esterase